MKRRFVFTSALLDGDSLARVCHGHDDRFDRRYTVDLKTHIRVRVIFSMKVALKRKVKRIRSSHSRRSAKHAPKYEATPTFHCEQRIYQGIEKVSKEKSPSIDGQPTLGDK